MAGEVDLLELAREVEDALSEFEHYKLEGRSGHVIDACELTPAMFIAREVGWSVQVLYRDHHRPRTGCPACLRWVDQRIA